MHKKKLITHKLTSNSPIKYNSVVKRVEFEINKVSTWSLWQKVDWALLLTFNVLEGLVDGSLSGFSGGFGFSSNG